MALFLAVLFYNKVLAKQDLKLLMVIAAFIEFFGASTTMMLTRGNTWGLPPVVYIIITTTLTDTLIKAYTKLPSMVLYAKIIPATVEASMFAIITGTSNLTKLFLAREVSNAINDINGCNDDNLETCLWKDMLAMMILSLAPMAFVWLLPTKTTISKTQLIIEYMEE